MLLLGKLSWALFPVASGARFFCFWEGFPLKLNQPKQDAHCFAMATGHLRGLKQATTRARMPSLSARRLRGPFAMGGVPHRRAPGGQLSKSFGPAVSAGEGAQAASGLGLGLGLLTPEDRFWLGS